MERTLGRRDHERQFKTKIYTLGQHETEQCTAESWFGGTAGGREPGSPVYSLGVSALPGSKAAAKKTQGRQEPGPTPFQSKKCSLVAIGENASNPGK